MKRTYRDKGIQLSLFGNDYRERTDRELIAELTNKPDQVAEEWEWNYSMERLYNRLTPQRRRIAIAAVELFNIRLLDHLIITWDTVVRRTGGGVPPIPFLRPRRS